MAAGLAGQEKQLLNYLNLRQENMDRQTDRQTNGWTEKRWMGEQINRN